LSKAEISLKAAVVCHAGVKLMALMS